MKWGWVNRQSLGDGTGFGFAVRGGGFGASLKGVGRGVLQFLLPLQSVRMSL